MGVCKETTLTGLEMLDKLWMNYLSAKERDKITRSLDLYMGAKLMLEELTGMETELKENHNYFKPPAIDRG